MIVQRQYEHSVGVEIIKSSIFSNSLEHKTNLQVFQDALLKNTSVGDTSDTIGDTSSLEWLITYHTLPTKHSTNENTGEREREKERERDKEKERKKRAFT